MNIDEYIRVDDMIVGMFPYFLANFHLGYTPALGWLCATVLLSFYAYPMVVDR